MLKLLVPPSPFFISDMKVFLSHPTTAWPSSIPLLPLLNWVISLSAFTRFIFHPCLLILNLFLQRNTCLLIKDLYFLKNDTQGLPWWRSGWESTCQWRAHGFEPWSGKIPHAVEQLSLCAKLLSLCSRACAPQLLSPCATTTEARAPGARAPQQEKPLQWEARAPQWRVAPARHN